MEKVIERTSKYEISVKPKSNGYYIARVSLKLGGGASNRYEKSGTTNELALLGLLDLIISSIDTAFNSGQITCRFDERIPQRLVSSINKLGITSPEAMEKTLLIVNKINNINAHILNNISLQNNVLPFYNSNVVPINNANNMAIMPTQANIISTTTPIVHNISMEQNVTSDTTPSKMITIEDIANEWHLYRLSLCQKTEDNPEPLSQKTIDGDYEKLKSYIIPYFKKNKIVYLAQITDETVKSLIKSIKSQHTKNKSYIVLNLLFQYAIENNKAKINPLEKVDKPPEKIENGEEDTDDNYIDPENQDKYIDKFEEINTDMSILFETMLLTGIRPEEACRT